MRTVATATTANEISGVAERLRGARATLGAAHASGDVLRLPLELLDSGHPQFGRSLLGYPTASVAVMQAYLVIGDVVSFEHEGSGADVAGELSLDYDEDRASLTVHVSPQAALRMSVSGIDVSVVVSDEQLGERALTMCT